ncbi:MAG: cell division protein FtsQ/DivIB [Limnohabitans sp.]
MPSPLPMDIRLMQLAGSLLLAVALVLSVLAGVWWLVRLPAFDLRLIKVEGEVTRNNALTLKTNVVPHLQGNFFTLQLEQAQQVFEAVPWVRAAVVRREFPNRLRVQLLEQQPEALWGEEGASTLLNRQGQIFEANLGEVEAEGLARLTGPASQSQQVLAMYQSLRSVLQTADMAIDELELSPRGSWRLLTAHGAVIELGRGQPHELMEQLQVFLRTLPEVASRYGRTPKALTSADLRHKDGYALKLQGVTTTDGDPRKKP